MGDLPLKHALNAAAEAAKQGGSILLDFYGKIEHIEDKQYKGELVTEADIASEKTLIGILQEAFPDYGILGEETGIQKADARFQWVIDPLDGTTNFAHTHPMFCVSIGLTDQGRPILGAIYAPLLNELYQAAEGLGATLNGSPIRVSKTNKLENSLLATGFAYDRRETPDNNYKEFCRLTDKTQGVRRGGSAALDLAYTACGRIDGYWERGIKPWDVAAGIILVQEAGGLVTRYDETLLANIHEERLLATNGFLHNALSLELISSHPSFSIE